MSDLEIIMYIALGFAVATLIALLLGRLMWKYAVSLGTRRSLRMAPSNLAELQAERDRLKAEYAMLSRKLEVRVHDLRTKLAEQTAEVSRSRNRIDRLAEELKGREEALAQREAELGRLREQFANYEAELATRAESAQQLTERLREREDAHAALVRELEAAGRAIAERDRQIERLKTELGYAIAEGPHEASGTSPPEGRLRQRIEHLTALSQQIEAQRRELMTQHTQYRELRDSMAELESASCGQPEEAATGAAEPAPVTVPAFEQQNRIESQTLSLEHQLEEAEKETDELKRELQELEAKWAAMMSGTSEPQENEAQAPEQAEADAARPERPDANAVVAARDKGESEPSAAGKKSVPGLANVISLANRIRSLQR